MKTLIFSTLFILFSIGFTFGQTEINSSSSNSNRQERSTKMKSTKLPTEGVSDGFMGYKDQIIKRLVVKEIPSNFPIPETGQEREDYKKIMLRWFKKNLDMVEEKYHSNLK